MKKTNLKIKEDDLTHPDVVELIRIHLQGMLDNSPPGTCFALDVDKLKEPGVTFWTAWDKDTVLGCVAMKELGPKWGEIKSMRAHPNAVGQGIGRALLDHIILMAKQRGYTKVSLETGTEPGFYPSIELYARNGFELGPVYADYIESPFNIYMHKQI